MKPSVTLFFLFAILFSQSAMAQKTGRVDYPTLGISFTIPSGWVGQETETGFLMGHNSIPGMILMIPHDQKYDLQAMRAEAQAGIKAMLWEGCENWDSLLEQRAEMSGRLVLSEFTKKALQKYSQG